MLYDLLALCKPKVVALILFTVVVGMLLAVPYLPDVLLMINTLIGIGLTAASAAVFNHIVDKKIDLKMSRTNKRPLPQGRISSNQALAWGAFLGIIGLFILFVFVNVLTAVLTFASLIGYAVIYTMYLKHATPQNIVIGGLAGATPPVLGWTAVAQMQGIEHALLLSLIVFVWTPPHFWALAIYKHEEYKSAKVPMLPVTHGLSYTGTHVLFYTALLFIVTLLPYLTAMSGVLYLAFAVVLGVIFLSYAFRVYLHPENTKIAFSTFVYSVNYLMLLFLGLLIDHYIVI